MKWKLFIQTMIIWVGVIYISYNYIKSIESIMALTIIGAVITLCVYLAEIDGW